jgi:hypothetical protein
LVEEHPRVECMYCLDAQGRQITETVFSGAHPPAPARFIFRPAPPGADHSLKEYYVRLMNGAAEHLTDPYVSQATGRLCRTLSIRCAGSAAESLIVCTDFVQS